MFIWQRVSSTQDMDTKYGILCVTVTPPPHDTSHVFLIPAQA